MSGKTRFECVKVCYTAGGGMGLYHHTFHDCLFGYDGGSNVIIIENDGTEWNFERRYTVYIQGKPKSS